LQNFPGKKLQIHKPPANRGATNGHSILPPPGGVGVLLGMFDSFAKFHQAHTHGKCGHLRIGTRPDISKDFLALLRVKSGTGHESTLVKRLENTNNPKLPGFGSWVQKQIFLENYVIRDGFNVKYSQQKEQRLFHHKNTNMK
jgi:hypothetical protein